MSIIVCQVKNTYLLYFVFPLDFRGLSKSEGGQGSPCIDGKNKKLLWWLNSGLEIGRTKCLFF